MRILLIEDEPKIASFVCQGLRACGMGVDHIDNGLDGLGVVLQSQHDLVVLDIMLPGLDGFELSWLIETSPGNHQGGIILAEPLTDAAEAVRLHNAIIERGLCDAGAKGPLSRWARLPHASLAGERALRVFLLCALLAFRK